MRTRRVPGKRDPGPGPDLVLERPVERPAGPRWEFLWVSPELMQVYHREARAIERRFPHFDEPPAGTSAAAHWDALASLRRSALRELRRAVRVAAEREGLAGSYPLAMPAA